MTTAPDLSSLHSDIIARGLDPSALMADVSKLARAASEASRIARSRTPQIKRLVRHDAQAQIVSESRRFNVASCGRRIGKSLLAADLLTETALARYPAAYFAPTYKMLLETWRILIESLKPVTVSKSEQEKRIEVQGGGSIDCWSLDTEMVARSRKYKRAIVDEAAHVSGLKDAWQKAIRPTLTDLKGDSWFFSTPNGMNDFWQLYQLGLDPTEPDWACWQMPTSANPYIDADEIEAARRMLPADIFAQEYLAEFIADSGAVFRHILAAATATAQEIGNHTHRYVIGCDWAKYQDFSVFTVIDTATRELVHMARYNRLEYQYQMDRLLGLCELFCPVAVSSEETGNVALQEQLRRLEYFDRVQGKRTEIPLVDYKATNASKGELVQALALAFERKDIKILNDPVLIGELQAFKFERTDAGNLRYSAPEGFHDDCVTSLMQAWNQAKRFAMTENLSAAQVVKKKLDRFGYEDTRKPADPIAAPYWEMSRDYHAERLLREEREARRLVIGDLGRAFADEEYDYASS